MRKPLIWAHRGASGYAPENTLLAFDLAIQQHADGIELDVQMTKDGQLVVIHDETIDRTSNGKGWVKDYTLSELRRFNFNKTHTECLHASIPTLEEVFRLVKPTTLTINIEFKTGIVFYEGIVDAVLEMVRKWNMEERVVYSSFNHYTCVEVKEKQPDAYVGFLYEDGPIDVAAYVKKHQGNALHPALYNLQYPNFLTDVQKEGLDVNVWTVNEEMYAKMCLQYQVHAIITNYPDKMREWIA